MTLAGTLETTRIGTMNVKKLPSGSAQRPGEDLLGIAGQAREEPPHLHQALVAHHPDRERRQQQHEAVSDRRAAGERHQEGHDADRVEMPALLNQSDRHEDGAHQHVGRGAPVDPPAR